MTARSPLRPIRRVLPVLASVALLASCGGGDSGTSGHEHDHGGGEHVVDGSATVDVRFEVAVVDGAVVGGVPRFEVAVGDVVEVVVEADVADQVHLHVYDAVADLVPGRSAALVVEAAIPGVFEAELHGSGLRVFELLVS